MTRTFREYYDLVSDPWQFQNLLADGNPSNDPNVAALSDQLARQRTCVGAAACNPSGGQPPPPPPPPPQTCPTGQHQAQYFNNTTLDGTPSLTQCEGAINYDWGSGSSAPGVNADSFSARWVGTHPFTQGTYAFTARSDDGIRVWVDGALLIDAWKNQPPHHVHSHSDPHRRGPPGEGGVLRESGRGGGPGELAHSVISGCR